jgi:hypothetical protein
VDLYGDHDRETLRQALGSMIPESAAGMVRDICLVSADTGEGIDGMIDSIHDLLPSLIKVRFEVPHNEEGESAVSRIRKRWNSVVIEYGSHGIMGSLDLEERWIGTIKKLIERGGGRILN